MLVRSSSSAVFSLGLSWYINLFLLIWQIITKRIIYKLATKSIIQYLIKHHSTEWFHKQYAYFFPSCRNIFYFTVIIYTYYIIYNISVNKKKHNKKIEKKIKETQKLTTTVYGYIDSSAKENMKK